MMQAQELSDFVLVEKIEIENKLSSGILLSPKNNLEVNAYKKLNSDEKYLINANDLIKIDLLGNNVYYTKQERLIAKLAF